MRKERDSSPYWRGSASTRWASLACTSEHWPISTSRRSSNSSPTPSLKRGGARDMTIERLDHVSVVGEVVQYEDRYRLWYMRGPARIIVLKRRGHPSRSPPRRSHGSSGRRRSSSS